MRVAIIGAGAIGAYIGGLLARAGKDVVLFARGPHLAAMREGGVRVVGEDEFTARPEVTDDIGSIGAADVVMLGVKAHSLPELAPRLAPIIGSDTIVVSTQNGIPWWYFDRHGGKLEGTRLERVDPGGVIARTIDAERILGSIVYFSTEVLEPGVIRHIEGNRVSLGELDGSRSDRCRSLGSVLNEIGLKCRVTTRIRHEIWVKLLGNVSFNPTSALTRATIGQMLADPGTRSLIESIMAEVEAVASRLGLELPVSVEQRMAGAEKVGDHKTSMLQDLKMGRPLEIEAVVGAVVELGGRLEVSMPTTRAVYMCARLLAALRESR